MGTILVAEDDDDLRELFAEVLRGENHCVICACNGEEALEAVHRCTPCLVLLDIMMPVMSGTEVLESLEEEHRLATLPVVVLSAIADETIRPRPRCYLRKPVELDRLLETVRAFCPS